MSSKRPGSSLFEVMQTFPDEATTHAWFARQRWGTDEGSHH